jgi:hypothetical protein
LHPIKLEATFGTRNIFGTTYLSGNVEGSIPILDLALVGVSAPSNDVIDSTISNATIENDSKVLEVGTNMDVKASISI